LIGLAIVTPSFNQGRFVERTIASVLDQAYQPLEYVVCDGLSTDSTSAVLDRYAGRLRAIVERDSGQANAVNKGIRATSGDVIGWLNSDDVYCPGALVTVAAYFARHPDVDVVYGDATLIDSNDRVIGRYYTRPWDPRLLPRRPYLCQPAVFFRRRVVERFGPLDESLQFNIDYEYWLRLVSGGARFAYLPVTLASSRVHDQTKTSTGGVRIHDELNHVLKRYVDNIPDAWILTHTHAVLQADRGGEFDHPFDFATAVALTSLRLSLEVNRSISAGLVLSTLRTLSAGAVKTVLGRPVVVPVD
jgi:glycosyltransferase involved in cell wall biosynthesis